MKEDNLLARGIDVIENLSSLGAMSNEQLHEKTGIPRSSVYRVLRILENSGYVSRASDGTEDKWKIDLKFLGLSAKILARVDLSTEIYDLLIKLADETREIVQLAKFSNGKALIVNNVSKHPSIIDPAPVGTVLEINECVAGLVFGAYLVSADIEKLLSGTKLPKLTDFTITNVDEFKSELERVRKRGYAVDDQFYAIGHRCIGAPIFDHTGHVVAEVNITGHIRTITDAKIKTLAATVTRSATEISTRMGYTGEIVGEPSVPSQNKGA